MFTKIENEGIDNMVQKTYSAGNLRVPDIKGVPTPSSTPTSPWSSNPNLPAPITPPHIPTNIPTSPYSSDPNYPVPITPPHIPDFKPDNTSVKDIISKIKDNVSNIKQGDNVRIQPIYRNVGYKNQWFPKGGEMNLIPKNETDLIPKRGDVHNWWDSDFYKNPQELRSKYIRDRNDRILSPNIGGNL